MSRVLLYLICVLVNVFSAGCCLSGHIRTQTVNGVELCSYTYPLVNGILRARDLNDEDIDNVGKALADFEMLDFCDGQNIRLKITDAGLEKLSEMPLPNLRTLLIGYNSHITDRGMKAISKLEQIESLSIVYSQAVTDEGLSYLAQMPNLKGFNFCGCPKITDAGMLHFKDHPMLEGIVYGDWRAVDLSYNSDSDFYLQKAPLIEFANDIDLDAPSVISQSAVDILKEARPGLDVCNFTVNCDCAK